MGPIRRPLKELRIFKNIIGVIAFVIHQAATEKLVFKKSLLVPNHTEESRNSTTINKVGTHDSLLYFARASFFRTNSDAGANTPGHHIHQEVVSTPAGHFQKF
jgi:hypothetical protein